MARRLKNIKTKEISLTKGDEKNSGAANDDARILFRKNRNPENLTETDMSDNQNQDIETEVDEDFVAFAEEHGDAILGDIGGDLTDEQAEGIIAMAYDNAIQEEAIGKAAEFIDQLTENTVPKAKYDELKKSAAAAVTLIEKMKQDGKVGDADAGPLSELRKSLTAGGAELSPEAEARISEVEKSLAKQARAESIAKAKTYGFGKAEDVADLETRIRKALGDKDADAFVGIVKAAGNLQKASPMLKPIGEDVGADAGDPIAKAKGVIEDIKKANPTFTEQQAFAKAIEQNPGLYRELEAARAAAAPRAA
ncbi:MAG: hypothetical protein KJZ75_11225 [Hyphomonadaceae bacterium]|nr:hypothetical protein [Hyphomonadaceae bacterium]